MLAHGVRGLGASAEDEGTNSLTIRLGLHAFHPESCRAFDPPGDSKWATFGLYFAVLHPEKHAQVVKFLRREDGGGYGA